MISTTNEPRGALTGRSSILAVLADSGPFHGLLLTILAHFGVPERFSRLTIPRVRLPVGHQHSQFWPILARFMDYYSLFWGLGVISMIDERQGTLTCWSSTLIVLADSGPFHGLLLTILSRFGVPEQFSRLTIPRVRLPVGHKHSQFWPTLARFVDY